MQPTYFDIEMISARATATDRAAQMPLLGLLSGLTLALAMWFAIAGLVWAMMP